MSEPEQPCFSAAWSAPGLLTWEQETEVPSVTTQLGCVCVLCFSESAELLAYDTTQIQDIERVSKAGGMLNTVTVLQRTHTNYMYIVSTGASTACMI